MKIGEILRKLADVIEVSKAKKDAEEIRLGAMLSSEEANAQAKLAAQNAMDGVDDIFQEPIEIVVSNDDDSSPETMVSPLQQKHELLKKAGGIPNNVGEFENQSEGDEYDEICELNDADMDELEMIKKMAGIGEPSCAQTVADSPQSMSINPKMNAAMAYFQQDDFDAE